MISFLCSAVAWGLYPFTFCKARAAPLISQAPAKAKLDHHASASCYRLFD